MRRGMNWNVSFVYMTRRRAMIPNIGLLNCPNPLPKKRRICSTAFWVGAKSHDLKTGKRPAPPTRDEVSFAVQAVGGARLVRRPDQRTAAQRRPGLEVRHGG